VDAGDVDEVVEVMGERAPVQREDVKRPAAGAKHAVNLGDRDARVLDVLEHVVREHDVE
jgi:hypothetical protein